MKLSVVRILFDQMDVDGDGVHYDEFMEGLKTHPDFGRALEVVGIRLDDVHTVFECMDLDGSGTVSCEEFVENITMMQNDESFKIVMFVKHHMTTLEKQLRE